MIGVKKRGQESGTGGSGSPNMVRSYYFNPVMPNTDLKQFICDSINENAEPLVILPNEVIILCSRDWTTDILNPKGAKFALINKSAGSYGAGQLQLTNLDLELVYSGELNPAPFLELEATTQTINLGEIGITAVENALNAKNPAIIIQSQAAGYRLVKTTSLGFEKNYLFLDVAGTYGLGNLQTTAVDFQLFSNQQNYSSTWTSGITVPAGGNNGDYYIRTTTGDLYNKSAGVWGIIMNIKGAAGRGITSFQKTSTSGLVDTYTVVYTDTSFTTLTVTNGATGATGPSGGSSFTYSMNAGGTYTLTSSDFATRQINGIQVMNVSAYLVIPEGTSMSKGKIIDLTLIGNVSVTVIVAGGGQILGDRQDLVSPGNYNEIISGGAGGGTSLINCVGSGMIVRLLNTDTGWVVY